MAAAAGPSLAEVLKPEVLAPFLADEDVVDRCGMPDSQCWFDVCRGVVSKAWVALPRQGCGRPSAQMVVA